MSRLPELPAPVAAWGSSARAAVRARGWQVVDPIRSQRRAVYVTGSARSGTTWVAELLAAPSRTRLVFEPLHHRSAAGRAGVVPHVEIGRGSEPLRRAVSDALDGRCRDPWVNTFQRRALVTRRVVKDIRPGLLPVVRSVAPDVPVVLVIRDPIAVSESRARLDTGGTWFDTTGALAELRVLMQRQDRLGRLARWAIELVEGPLGGDPRTPHLALWVVENAVALDATSAPGARHPVSGVTVLRYERLVDDPDHGLAVLADAAQVPVDTLGDVSAASSTRFDGAGAPSDGGGTVHARPDARATDALRAAAATWLPEFATPIVDTGE